MMNVFTKQNTILLGLLSSVMLFFSACDQSVEIPSYIQIDDYTITTNVDLQGSDSDNIQDVWVYANGRLLGAFNLPATIPVLETGLTNIIIDPGIRENGLNSAPRVYPYYTRFETEVELITGETVTISPSSSYASNVEFPLIEDFEESNFFVVDLDNDDATEVVISAQGAIDGFAGRVDLTTDHPAFAVGTSFFLENLPTDGSAAVYLELDYKNDIPLALGLVAIENTGQESTFYSHVLNAKGDWNKVYINFSELLINTQAAKYQVTFASTLPDEVSSATILLDNIKVIHR